MDTTNQDNIAPNDIIEAVSKGQISTVKTLLDNGANANQKGKDSKPLLLIATEKKDLAMAKLLIQYGANVNQQDNILDSPFYMLALRAILNWLNFTSITVRISRFSIGTMGQHLFRPVNAVMWRL
ncbi:hypothetical protein KUH03_21995 [Sphingobacterium sp. E70]|uniref:ankyrin repeat domain-containing protein n=1 Tax=Sphingobacterium sp. E70 TaxID=2853439 RepID=UPI00211CDF2F|nr:ankyrin repeat domain-containing protein [Sphingobacterium sp. E70]ULT22162.1 hypothetical protein KUH03_21995 [Sphingobacterium sp. E70]